MRALVLLALVACASPVAPEPKVDPCVRADSQAVYPPDGSKWWVVAWYNTCDSASGVVSGAAPGRERK